MSVESTTKKRIYLKPIPRDEKFEKLDKKYMRYRNEVLKRMCITCLNPATQMVCYELDGCTKIERYCEDCASKITNQFQSTSGM